MSIYREVAEKLKATRMRLETQVQDLDKQVDAMGSHGDEVVRRHERVIDNIRGELRDMEQSVRELEGNGGDNVATFPPKTASGG